MKIKTKQKLNLPELIQHVWESDFSIKGFMVFRSDCDKFEVRISSHMLDYVWDKSSKFSTVPRHTTFTVEVEEELTEETKIPGATFVYYDELKREIKPFRYADVTSPTLEHIIQPRPGTVALAVFRGKQLIWTRDLGIPADGVLEVDQNERKIKR